MMVIFLSSLNSIGQSVFELESGNGNVDGQMDGITPISKGTYLWWSSVSLSSLNSIGQTVFKLESGNENFDGQTNGQTNGWNYTNFERNLAVMVIYLPVKFEFDRTKHFRVRVRKCVRTDRRTDVGHIDLIGGLVIRNLPKNLRYSFSPRLISQHVNISGNKLTQGYCNFLSGIQIVEHTNRCLSCKTNYVSYSMNLIYLPHNTQDILFLINSPNIVKYIQHYKQNH